MTEESRNERDMENLTTEIFSRWSHVQNFETMQNMITFNMDFVICGPPGSGKSRFLEDLAAVTNIQPKYVIVKGFLPINKPKLAILSPFSSLNLVFTFLGELSRAQQQAQGAQ